MTTPQERIGRVQEWLSSRPESNIDKRDAELVAALGVRSESVVCQLALHQPAALLADWLDLVAAIEGVIVPEVLPEASRARQRGRRARVGQDEAAGRVTSEPPAEPVVPVDELTPVLDSDRRTSRRRSRESPSSEAAADPLHQPAITPSDASQVDIAGFAPFDWAAERRPLSEAQALTFSLSPDGRVQMAWPPLAVNTGQVVIYRIVANMDGEPFSPDDHVLQATTGLTAINDDPRQDPYLHVQVWANVGADLASAKASQPVLQARGLLVLPPPTFDVVASEGQVVGRWHVASDDVTVDVMWVDEQMSSRVHGFDRTRMVESVVQGGFTHHRPPSGRQLEYRVVARTEQLGGDQQVVHGASPYLSRTVATPAVIEAVVDLEVSTSELDSSMLDLSWTAPAAGSVDIYMTDEAPRADISRQDLLDRTALENVVVGDPLINPTSREGGRTWMRNVPWQRSWARAWFIPVTVLGEEQMKAGPVQVRSRPPEPVSQVRLIDRVDTKFLTFAWPEAVELVRVYIMPAGVPLNADSEAPVAELTQGDYRRFGGLPLPVEALDEAPATVYAVSTSYASGRPILAKAVPVQYDGLRQLRYRLNQSDKVRNAQVAPHLLRIESKSNWDAPVRFGLYVNPNFLPLSTEDGALRFEWTWQPSVSEPFEKELDLSPARGSFVRIFVIVGNEEQRRIAIKDPPIEQLRIL